MRRAHVGEPLQLLGTGVLLSAADAAAREQHGGATHNVIEKVWPLINAAGGRTFVLCTSLAAVRAAADELQARLEANGNPYPLFVQGDGPKMRLIEEFRAHGNAVLVGSMSFWEGGRRQG